MDRKILIIPLFFSLSLFCIMLITQENYATNILREGTKSNQDDDSNGFILNMHEGTRINRHLIKVDKHVGSENLGLGVYELASGLKVPIHKHEHEDEILVIDEGKGIGYVGNKSKEVKDGSIIFIPKGVWHGVHNTDSKKMKITWIVSPPIFPEFLKDKEPGSGERHGHIYKKLNPDEK
ncbi:MAG: cupin domain-containing protein [Flavobacteriaceae bacterium]|nr:cupin domain-containing protein [Flavobacteriaceae bacterium]